MTFIIKERQAQNQYYDDPIAEDILPLQMMLIPAASFIMGSPQSKS
jgi:hypothetical protein